MAVNLSFIGGAGWQFLTNDAQPLSGGKLYTYAAGTTTPLTTYTSRTGATPNTNPIILDSAGRTPEQIWSTEGLLYKYVVKDSDDVTIRSWDNIGGSVVASDLAQDLAAPSGSSLVGFLQSGTGAVATTVQTKLRETVSVKDFGAVGDGVTDDAAAIQTAINALPNNTVLEIHGNFFLSDNLYMVAKTNVVLDFTGSVLSNSKACLLYVEDCDNVVIQGISGYTTSGTSPGTQYDPAYVPPSNFLSFAIMVFQCQNVTIQNNNMNLGGALPIAIEQGSGHAMLNNKVSNGGDNTLYMYNVNYSVIANNIVENTNTGRAICFQRGIGNIVSSNTVSGGYGFGISVVGGAATNIVGNTIQNVAYDSTTLLSQGGISVEAQEAADVSTPELNAANANLYLFNGAFSRSVTVSGNTVNNSGSGVIVGLGPQGNWGVVNITGNTITNSTNGMLLVSCRGPASIRGNKIRGCQQAGILVQGVFNQTTIDTNDIEDTNLASYGYTGIHKDTGVSGLLDLVISKNNYLFSGRSNFAYTEVSYVLDWPDTPIRSIFRDGDTTIISAEGSVSSASGSYQTLVDLTSYMGTLSIANVTFQMGQTDRNPIPMAQFTYAQSSNTNYYQTKVVAGTEDVRINNGVLEVLANNGAILGYGGAWRAIVTINKFQ